MGICVAARVTGFSSIHNPDIMTSKAIKRERISPMTPLEEKILNEFVDQMRQESVDEQIVDALLDGFKSEKLPSADVLASLIKEHSGGPSA